MLYADGVIIQSVIITIYYVEHFLLFVLFILIEYTTGKVKHCSKIIIPLPSRYVRFIYAYVQKEKHIIVFPVS